MIRLIDPVQDPTVTWWQVVLTEGDEYAHGPADADRVMRGLFPGADLAVDLTSSVYGDGVWLVQLPPDEQNDLIEGGMLVVVRDGYRLEAEMP